MTELPVYRFIGLTALLLAALGIAFSSTAAAVDSSMLRQAVTVEGVRTHQAQFQAIADANDGNRWDGSPGHFISVDYVAALLQAAGYDVVFQPFTYEGFFELEPAVLDQIAPVPTVYPYDSPSGFMTMGNSGSGDVTASTQGVDTASADSGCEVADFAGFVPGNIAIIKRGVCFFALKAQNAQAAGASAVVVFNDGTPGRTDAISGTLGADPGITIPVVFSAFDVGVELAAGVTARVFVNAATERDSGNLVAESPGGRADHVVVVGAHLDSVQDGPGIQDNGSGSAAILEIALKMRDLGIEPFNKLRFIWWGASEQGLAGSDYYVNNLAPGELASVRYVLNFDGIGSPNFVRFVYDGNGSDTGDPGPAGSSVIEAAFLDHFENVAGGLPTEAVGTSLFSDHLPFVFAGIPAGGLFTGFTGIKTPAQAAIFGGSAGDQYDPCFHLACDTFDNISLQALDEMSDAAAHGILNMAMLGRPIPPIPVLSDWSVSILLSLLLVSGLVGMRRRGPRSGSSARPTG